MNIKQLQMTVCKALIEGKRCGGCFINEREFAVTVDGFTAHCFSVVSCVFDIGKVEPFETLKPLFEDNDKDVELKQSKRLFYSNGDLLEKYVGESLEVYIRQDIAKTYKGFRFYANSPLGRVLVKDEVGRTVGLFLPVRFTEPTKE